MYIPFRIIKELWAKENLHNLSIELDASDTQNAQIFRIDEKKGISINLILTDEYLQKLEAQKVENISIYYNQNLMKLLKRHYPQRYHTEETASLNEIEKIFSQFEAANSLSFYDKKVFKKRFLKILQDIITPDTKIKKIVAMYNELLDVELMRKIKTLFFDSVNIDFVQSERGILMILDNENHMNNPELVRLQFMVRKIFNDVNYSNIKIVDVKMGFKEYFEPLDLISKKLIILVGKTPSLIKLFKMIKIFDPFSKIIWMTAEHLSTKPDLIFDSIIQKLNQDYSQEYRTNMTKREEKAALSQNEVQMYRKHLAEFSRKFNLDMYIELAYDIQEKGKTIDMFQPKTHLMNILLDSRYSPAKIFDKIINS
ncbi:MAG: hypothetical protein KKH98_00410 [Spirochaetes bacterium]|nr:hypothetical protein [Spirochaetota bacterium]